VLDRGGGQPTTKNRKGEEEMRIVKGLVTECECDRDFLEARERAELVTERTYLDGIGMCKVCGYIPWSYTSWLTWIKVRDWEVGK
jgi:hypothetical protein